MPNCTGRMHTHAKDHDLQWIAGRREIPLHRNEGLSRFAKAPLPL